MVSMTSVDWQAVLLALLNTTPVVEGQLVDLLGKREAALAWLRAHGAQGRVDLDGVRRLRDDLQRVVRAEAGGRPERSRCSSLPTRRALRRPAFSSTRLPPAPRFRRSSACSC